MQHSENLNELAMALSKAQGEITGALKDSANPFFKSKYADLASCWDACRGALSKNGLAVTQFPVTDKEGDEGHETYLVTTLLHSSGQWMRSSLLVQPKDDTPQAMGSALTYARRYALTAVVGVAQVDDDGNAASGRQGADPRGDLGRDVAPDLATSTANAMRARLTDDVSEEVRIAAIGDLHHELAPKHDLYVAASDLLPTKLRSAWKEYVRMGKERDSADRRMRA